ncbi:xanthine dehydrogenase family protein molybdopterin-binding subunit [Ramlibacter tataouinensis]|uniref:xanthine dehydrogenase family protein molybdopterin-binding subunit n=1 Tax=Ramlibacter tataouinensis TaxID=94132 RepID=UPI0022F3A78D|nr:xanthine dehydrogenase family protein molybdopterin-binding subunit [Ramlibacter tataouinensis]WBY00544.1 xanthine dehydrogenase family protein molybdopterin-binding subunit [Ramlibacter tataouinensis]
MREDLLDKALGQAQYVSDVRVPGMLHAKLLRSTVPHARIRGIDVSRALELPGIHAVLTGEDLAGLNAHWGLYLKDRPVIAIGKVRYVGEPIAAVAADTEAAAEEACELIEVDYELLPHVTTASEALVDGAPLVHERMETLKDFYFSGQTKAEEGTNVFQRYAYSHGDVQRAFESADHVFEDEFSFPMVSHMAMEPHCGVASWDGEGVTLWSCGQSPAAIQKVVSRVFDLPLARIRVITPFVGGGFGGKASVKIDPLVAAIARKAGRPVRLCFSSAESMLTCRRLDATVRLKTAVRADGTIVAKQARVLLNGGAYADTGPAIAVKAANRSIGPYRVPNLELESVAAYTNTVPGAAFRSIGGPQAVWATESQMDMIAMRLGIDPVELRRRNMIAKGEHVRPDLRPIDVDVPRMLDTALTSLGDPQGKAVGVAVGASDPGILPIGGALVRLKVDGSVLVSSASVEIGQGVRGVLRKFAADALNQPLECIHVLTPDTATAPFDWGTGASRSTVIMGLAIEEAAQDIVRQLGEMAQLHLGVKQDELRIVPGGVSDGTTSWTFAELIHLAYRVDSGELIGVGRITPQSRSGSLAQAPLFWETAAGACTLIVDEDTGQVAVDRYVSCADVGRVINRSAAEGQDEGAAVQALGHTLSEEIVYEDGQPINASMIDYHVPTINDVPRHFHTVLIESGDGPGPGGARGMGEGAILPLAPAVANALYRAHGVRIRELPITPEKVWRALQEQKKAD